jgi:O-antigen ligase
MVVFILAAASAKFALLDSPQGRWTRRVWILLLLLDYQMVILSGSRGGAVGALALLVAWLVMRLGFRRMLIRVVPPAVLAVGLLLALVPRGGEYSVRPGLSQLFSRFEETSTESGSSSGIRLYLWQRAAEEIRDGGVWIGSSSSRFVEKYEHYPHNTVLDAALETGVPGAVLLVLVVGYSLFVMLAQRRHLQGYQLHIFYLGISFWSTLMFLSSFSAKAFWLSVVLPLGLSVRVSREIASRRARRRGSGGEA